MKLPSLSKAFPSIALVGSILIAALAINTEDKEARQDGMNYAAAMLAIAGTAYQVQQRNDDEKTPPNPDTTIRPTKNHNPDQFL